jgi:hypothetical protein
VTPIARLDSDDAAALDPKIEAARRLFADRGAWLKPHQRIEILRNTAALMEGKRDHLGRQIAREGGKPLTDALFETERAIDGVRNAAEELRVMGGGEIPMGLTPASVDRRAFRFAVVVTFPEGAAAAGRRRSTRLPWSSRFWDSVKEGSPAELESYLERSPEGTFASLARTRRDAAALSPADAVTPAPLPRHVDRLEVEDCTTPATWDNPGRDHARHRSRRYCYAARAGADKRQRSWQLTRSVSLDHELVTLSPVCYEPEPGAEQPFAKAADLLA